MAALLGIRVQTGAGLRLQRPDCRPCPRPGHCPTPQSAEDSGVPAPRTHRRKLWSGAGSQVQAGSQPLLFLPHPESLEGKRWAQRGKGAGKQTGRAGCCLKLAFPLPPPSTHISCRGNDRVPGHPGWGCSQGRTSPDKSHHRIAASKLEGREPPRLVSKEPAHIKGSAHSFTGSTWSPLEGQARARRGRS